MFNNGHVEQQVFPNPETLTNHSCCCIYFLNMGCTRRRVAGTEMQGKSVTNRNIFKVKYSVDVKRGNVFELCFFPNERIFLCWKETTALSALPAVSSRGKPFLWHFQSHSFQGCKELDQKQFGFVISHLCEQEIQMPHISENRFWASDCWPFPITRQKVVITCRKGFVPIPDGADGAGSSVLPRSAVRSPGR